MIVGDVTKYRVGLPVDWMSEIFNPPLPNKVAIAL